MVSLPNESNARFGLGDLLDFGGRSIARAVVDHQHFDLRRIIVRENRAQS